MGDYRTCWKYSFYMKSKKESLPILLEELAKTEDKHRHLKTLRKMISWRKFFVKSH
jgi:hypothetical protein